MDAQGKANIENLENWFNETYNKINTVVTEETSEVPSAETPVVILATEATEELTTSSYSGYGYGALAISAAATVIYLYKKRQEDKRQHLTGESQALDEGFVSV